MKKIGYAGQTIQVPDDFFFKFQEMEKERKNSNQRETRRHASLSKALDSGFNIKDTNPTAEDKLLVQDEYEELYSAIAYLTPNQQNLINKIYFQDMTVGQVAKEEGVTSQAISNRLKRIMIQLRFSLIPIKD